MQFLFREIQEALVGFLSSPSDRLLLVMCDAQHSPMLLKAIDALEGDPDSPDIFLTFPQAFGQPQEYVAAISDSIVQQAEYVNGELAKRGDPPLAEPPRDIRDASLRAPERLLAGLRYVRRVVPPDRNVAWVLFPDRVDDPERFAQFVGWLVARMDDDALPGMKAIVRDSTTSPALSTSFADRPGVKIFRPDFDPAALAAKLEREANNPALPAMERAQAHMMLAGIDVANKRFDVAMARNQELLGYFYHSGQTYQQAIVLNNIGDLFYVQGQFPESQEWYERAVALSVGMRSQPLVLYQSINLGNALLAQHKFDEALPYYRSAAQLAEATNAPIHQVQALERMGEVHQRAGRHQEAIACWEKGAAVSGRLHYQPGEKSALEHLQSIFAQLGDAERLATCRAALAQLSP